MDSLHAPWRIEYILAPKPAQAESLFARIAQSSDDEAHYVAAIRSQKIVSNLLSFARAHTPERKFLGVNGILEKTLELRKYQLRAHGIEVSTDFDPLLPMTMLDFHQMQQVLLNLIHNAEHAMSEAGRKGRLRIRTSRAGGSVRIEIEDNGVGMGPDVLDRVFDPFFTTKPQGKGTGLGLSISYGIVKEHGGTIRAESRKGLGSIFTHFENRCSASRL